MTPMRSCLTASLARVSMVAALVQGEVVRMAGHPEEPLQPRRICGLGTSTWMGKPSHWEDPSA